MRPTPTPTPPSNGGHRLQPPGRSSSVLLRLWLRLPWQPRSAANRVNGRDALWRRRLQGEGAARDDARNWERAIANTYSSSPPVRIFPPASWPPALSYRPILRETTS